ncbi:response regulator transcription factor [Haloechinothrix sp. LS1_15]|uniref:response regulator transcription factor n=1 Tax=Haloechinothrix sp. LS1_15 TaxID=2652248 RepID=UPI00294B43B3|nr:response regulator transcription factor [Haloechinothrix sp. LS1_15]
MISVLLAEDMHLVRGALSALIDLEPDLTVVAEVSSGDVIVPTALEHRPDVAVIDIDLPGKDGLVAAAELRQELPGCRTLIVTGLGKPGTVRRALAASVNGFIVKDAPADALANAIRGVAAGRRIFDGDLALAAWESEHCPLTPRELEILRHTAQGSSTKEIAATLYLSQGTVRNYLTTVVNKLNARNRVDAIRIAEESGWI